MAQDRKTVLLGAALVAVLAVQAGVHADEKTAAADANTKQLLLLMDKDQNGKVSKQEFMSFMEAEFDRLDRNKDGELDVDELTRFHYRSSGPHK